jgi:hypothetical protein
MRFLPCLFIAGSINHKLVFTTHCAAPTCRPHVSPCRCMCQHLSPLPEVPLHVSSTIML